MAVVILKGDREGQAAACLTCNTTDWAFGPVFGDEGLMDAWEVAEAFKLSLPCDPRTYEDNELEAKYGEFITKLRKDQDDARSNRDGTEEA